jgi:predicted RND superfamily exporter protein
MLDRLAQWVVAYPRSVIVVVALITAIFAVGALNTRIDSSAGTLVDSDSPAYRYYEDVRETFGSDETDIVALVSDGIFTAATLAKIDALTDRLFRIEGVADVESLSTVRNLTASADGDIDRSPVMNEPPTDPAAIAALRATVRDNPLFNGTLVSDDERSAAIFITYEPMAEGALVASGVHRQIEAILDEFEGPELIYFSGVPRIKVEAARLIESDILVLGPISFIAVSIVLFIAFRTWRGTLLPALTTGAGTIWTAGLMGFLDVPINIVTLVLPTFLLAVGNAYATHIVARHAEEQKSGFNSADAARRTLAHLGVPVFVTALTTMLGFASLLAYRIRAIRDLGLFSVFGIIALFVLSLTFTVAVLSLLRAPAADGPKRDDAPTGLNRALDRIGRFAIDNRHAVIAGACVVFVLFAWGASRVQIETTYLSYFPQDDPVRQSVEMVNEHLGMGDAAFFVAIDGPESDSITRLDTLHRIAALQDFIDRLPEIVSTTSIVDYVKLLHRSFHDNDPAYHGLPATDAAVAQYMLMLDPETLDGVLSGDSARGIILVRSKIHVSATMNDVVDKIERFALDAFPSEFNVRATGTRVILDRTADELALGQVGSLVTALLVVFVTLSLQFLSPRFGIVAMAPNLVPIVMFFGILGWSSTPLGMATAMIAAITLGIGVDEAVHLLAEFNSHIRKNADQRVAVLAALQSIGPPILYNTAALVVGVLVLLWSNFVPLQQFGAFTAVNVVMSLLVDLLVLPAILVTTRFVTLWDVLTVKLGGVPQDEIPLFHGLTRSQAKVTVLMGVLKTVQRGEFIVREGDPGHEMYVIISGHARMERRVETRVVAIREIERGGTIGEMGLVRGQTRSADVIAVDESELLVVDDRFLATLRHRYPRIAATVFLNLTRILSDRLESADLRTLAAPGTLSAPN